MQTEAPESMMSMEVLSDTALRQVAFCKVVMYVVGAGVDAVVGV